MQNCYNKKFGEGSQVPLDVLIDQDERLKLHQVETLSFVQDIARTNKELAARIKVLETKIGECSRLHVDTESANQMVATAKAEAMQRADEINKMLMEKHQEEMNSRIHAHAEEEKSWCSLKQSLQAELFKNQKIIEELRHENGKRLNEIQQLRVKLEGSRHQEAAELASLREAQVNLLDELSRSRETARGLVELRQELGASEQQRKELQFRLHSLETELQEARAAGHAEQLTAAKEKIRQLKAQCEQLTDLAQHLRQQRETAEREESDVRERLETRLAAAEREVLRLEAALAAANANAAPALASEKRRGSNNNAPNFREFVSLKRQVAQLREENLALKDLLRATAANTAAKPLPPISPAPPLPRQHSGVGKETR